MLRLAVLGGTSLLLACSAHLAGGGQLPPAGLLVVVGVLLGLVSLAVTVRRCRLPLLLVLLGAEQALLHLVFDAASAGARCVGGLPGTGLHGTGHSSAAADQLVSGCVVSSAGMTPMMMPDGVMWAAHLLAILVTAWLLARGEAFLWGVAERFVVAATASPTDRRRPDRQRRGTSRPVAGSSGAPRAAASPRGPPVLTGC